MQVKGFILARALKCYIAIGDINLYSLQRYKVAGGSALMVEIERGDKVVEDVIRAKLRRNIRNVMVTTAIGENYIYLLSPDEALSVAMLYSIYLYARQRGLEAKMYYVTSVDPDKVLPEEVRRVGEAWTRRRLSKEEIAKLRSKFITRDLLDVLIFKPKQ